MGIFYKNESHNNNNKFQTYFSFLNFFFSDFIHNDRMKVRIISVITSFGKTINIFKYINKNLRNNSFFAQNK